MPRSQISDDENLNGRSEPVPESMVDVTFSEEEIEDHVLGWLPASRSVALETQVLIDHGLADRLHDIRRTLRPLAQLGADLLTEPVPERLRACLRPGRR